MAANAIVAFGWPIHEVGDGAFSLERSPAGGFFDAISCGHDDSEMNNSPSFHVDTMKFKLMAETTCG